MRKIFSILVFALCATSALSVDVTIYTKDFAPFSVNGQGYSIDYLNEVLINTFGNANLTANVVVVADNTAIFNAVSAFNATESKFALGTAGITITKAREAIGNFLPKFFSSGFQVLVKNTGSWSDVAGIIAGRLVRAFLAVVIIVGFVVYLLGGLCWYLETKFCPENAYTIFINYTLRRDAVEKEVNICDRTFTIPRKLIIMFWELFNACYWVGMTLLGVKTGYPSSTYTQYVHSMLKGLSRLLMILAIGVASAIFAVSATESGINGFDDMRGKTVCTVAGSTSESYLDENNYGYGVRRTGSINDMFASFWSDKCDAVVYDFPALQQALADNGGGATIVGEIFNQEDYGIFMASNGPHQEILRQNVNDLNLNHGYINTLKDKWFTKITTDGDQNTDVPWIIYGIPLIIGIGTFVYFFYDIFQIFDDTSEEQTKSFESQNDTNFKNDLEEVMLAAQSTESIYFDNDWILDKIYPIILKTVRLGLMSEMRERGEDPDVEVAYLLPQRVETRRTGSIELEMGEV